jgi:Flp pilus assembly pilin Flp
MLPVQGIALPRPHIAARQLTREIVTGAAVIAMGLVLVVIAAVLLSTVQGIGTYILTALNSSGTIRTPNYVESLNLPTVMTLIGVAMIIVGAVFIIWTLIHLGREAKSAVEM